MLFRALHESLYGCMATIADNANATNGELNVSQVQPNPPTANGSAHNIDADLAMALRISEAEQRQRQEELQREQEMLEEVLRLSLQEK